MALKTFDLKIAWRYWGIIAFSFFLAFFHRTSVGTVQDEICSEFGLSRTAFGIMASMYFYAYMILQIPVGLLADNWGPRRTVTAGVLLGGAATILFGFAVNPTMLFIGRFFIGAGMATIFVCLLKIQAQWFPSKMFATLSGLSVVAGNLGGMAGQFPFAILALLLGWQNSYLVIALITIASGLACFFLVKDKPEDAGLQPLSSQNNVPEGKPGLIEGVKIILRENRIYAAAFVYLFNQGAFIAFTGAWLVPWLREVHRMSSATAASFGTFAIIGMMTGSILGGFISDRLKRRKPVIIAGSIICTCIWGLMVIWKTGDHFIIGSLLFALGLSSSVFSLSMSIAKEVSPISLTGTAIAVINTMGFLGIASGTSLLGFIADLGENLSIAERFGNVLITCLVFSAMSLFSSFFCYETHAQNAAPKKL